MKTLLRVALLLVAMASASANFQRDVVRNKQNIRVPKELKEEKKILRDILSSATLVRRAEENDDDDDDYYLDEMYSLSGYSLKYARCQAIQRFSEEAIQNGEYSPMVKDDIVILRLCPTNQCSSNKKYGCYYKNYVEYAIGISDYIRIMLRYTVEKRKSLCNFCDECNNRRLEDRDEEDRNEGEEDRDNEDNKDEEDDRDEEDDKEEEGDQNSEDDNEEEDKNDEEGDNDGGDDEAFDDDDYYKADDDDAAAANNDDEGAANDDGGYGYCQAYADDCDEVYNWCNGQADDDAGYIDYMDYLEYIDCVKVEGQDNYGDAAYWIKPRCDAYKGTIMMAIFYDPYCSQYAGDEVNLREFSGVYFRSSIFEDYYAGACIDCSESNYPPFYDSNSMMCNKMHATSAVCTSNMMYQIFDEEDDDSVQCSFIESVRTDTYNEKGEINVDSSQFGESVKAEVTNSQKLGIAATAVLVMILAVYSCYLHHSITNLLIKSLSHSHLLPPSRHRSRSKSGSRRRGSGNGSTRGRRDKDNDWDTSTGQPA